MLDDTELREPKICCYRKGWIASRALIWSFVSIGATLFSIGYVLKVFTHHYQDSPTTANAFDYSGTTLVSIGGALAGLGIVACFHSCCVVLCYRPANKPDKTDTEKGDTPIKSADFREGNQPVNLPVKPPGFDYNPRRGDDLDDINRQQQTPLLQNGSKQPLLNTNFQYRTPPPQRSATSPKIFPFQEESTQQWTHLQDADRRRYQSHMSVQRTNEWPSDNDSKRYKPVIDKSPEQRPWTGNIQHPYADDFLEKLRTRPVTSVSSDSESKNKMSKSPAPLTFDDGSSEAIQKPLFQIGGHSVEKRDPGPVWEQRQAPETPRKESSTSKSPSTHHRSNSGRHRQYFHEEHFAFSDFEPDDAFLAPNEQEFNRQDFSSNVVVVDERVKPSPKIVRIAPPRSPIHSAGDSRSQQAKRNHLPSSPKPHIIIPPPSGGVINVIPVSSSTASPTVYYQRYDPDQSQDPYQGNTVEIIEYSHPQAPLSGGSTSSGRGSGSRGAIEQQDNTQIVYSIGGTAHQSMSPRKVHLVQPSSDGASASLSSPCVVRRSGPHEVPRRITTLSSSGRSHEQTPEYSGREQTVIHQVPADIEMRNFIKTSNVRARASPTRTIPSRHEFIYPSPSTRTSVIKGQSPTICHIVAPEEEDLDSADVSSPDPDNSYLATKKSPRRERIRSSITEQQSQGGGTVFMTATNKTTANADHQTSVLVAHLPAQDPYSTTNAFLFEEEEGEII